jgi:Ca2+-binding EF-hand superfamily protein
MVNTTTDASSKIPPAQLREIREAFQVLDRDNDGLVNKDDVADVLTNLGRYLELIKICDQRSSAVTDSMFFSRPRCKSLHPFAILPTWS